MPEIPECAKCQNIQMCIHSRNWMTSEISRHTTGVFTLKQVKYRNTKKWWWWWWLRVWILGDEFSTWIWATEQPSSHNYQFIKIGIFTWDHLHCTRECNDSKTFGGVLVPPNKYTMPKTARGGTLGPLPVSIHTNGIFCGYFCNYPMWL